MAGLAEFMNDQLSDRPGPRLAASGPSSLRLGRAVRNEGLTESVLASLYWWCYVRSSDFQDALTDALYNSRDDLVETFPETTRQIIVSHAQGSRHDLLVLAAGVREPQAIRIRPNQRYGSQSRDERDVPGVALREAPRLQEILARAGINIDERTIPIAVAEMAREGKFGLVATAPPEENPTGITRSADPPTPIVQRLVAPAPALPVHRPGDLNPVATAGVIGTGQDGRVIAITARHAITDERQLLVAGSTASIAHEDVLTDTCVLLLTCPSGTWPGTGRAGTLKITPTEHRPAIFHGATSPHKKTWIRGYDLSVLDPSPYLSSKIYTDPDTMPGDSGAALIDSDDHIAGFAVSRTSYDAPLTFSAWSWGDQVLTRHELT